MHAALRGLLEEDERQPDCTASGACRTPHQRPTVRLTDAACAHLQGLVSGPAIPWWMTDRRRRELEEDVAEAGPDTEKGSKRVVDPSRCAACWPELL